MKLTDPLANAVSLKRTRIVSVIPPESDGPTYLSRLITARRHELRLSQNDLAVIMKRSQPFVQGIEVGRVWNLSWMDIEALAQGLEMSLPVITEALSRTYRALLGITAPADNVPKEDGDTVMTITNGELVVRARDPELRGTTKAERAAAGVGEFSTTDLLSPRLKYPGVNLQPIHIDDIPLASDDPIES